MQMFWTALCGAIGLGWILAVMDTARGVRTIPSLASVAPPDADCPSVSILFAARDEGEKLPDALETFLALDYPRYEVIAVDDRSEDATPEILAAAEKKDARLKAVRVDSLPSGWENRTDCSKPMNIPQVNGLSSPMQTFISLRTCCGARLPWHATKGGTI